MRIILSILLTLSFITSLFAQDIALENNIKSYDITGDVKQIKESELYTRVSHEGQVSSWVGRKYTIYKFNTYGNLTEKSYYENRDSIFRRQKSEYYIYDKTNKLIRVETKDTADKVIIKYDLTYTTIRIFIKKYEAGILTVNEVCTLNDKGKCTYRVASDASGKQLYIISYTYNNSGQLIRMSPKAYKPGYISYPNSYAYVYANDRVTKEIRYDGAIADESTLEYDSLGHVIYRDHTDEGKIDMASIYTYDKRGNWTSKKIIAMLGRNMPETDASHLGANREILYYSEE